MYLFRKPWIFLTPLVVLAALVMVRLGIWQLDRLEQRRTFNAQVLSQIDQPPLVLSADTLPEDWQALAFRSVVAEGVFDFEHQVVLGNQEHAGRMGVHLLTPLRIAGTGSVLLVDRGWVPYEDWQSDSLTQYDQPGAVRVEGMLAAGQSNYGIKDCIAEGIDPALTPELWCVDTAYLSSQTPYALPPAYIIQAPTQDAGEETVPYRALPHIEINEGPHLSYAIQWFSFAILLLAGYPFFVYREMQARTHHDASLPSQE
ncbi:MAG: SURF1 family protein [Anaerolineales bacterium]